MYEFQFLMVNIIRDRLTRHHYPQDVQTFLQIKNQIWNWDFTSIGEYLQPQPLWTATPPLDHWPALPHQNYSDRAAATATVRRAATLNTLDDLTRNPPIPYNHLLVLSNKVLYRQRFCCTQWVAHHHTQHNGILCYIRAFKWGATWTENYCTHFGACRHPQHNGRFYEKNIYYDDHL